MREFQEKRQLRNMIFSRPVIFLASAVVLWFAVMAVKGYIGVYEARLQRLAVEQELNNTKSKAAVLESSLRDMESESGMEKMIRERFNVKKPGEKVIIIVNKDNGGVADGTQSGRGFLASLKSAVTKFFGF